METLIDRKPLKDENGKMIMAGTRERYGEVLAELGGEDPRIVVLDADLSKSTRTEQFGKSFPDRFFNMGIAESNMMGFAAGLALSGKTVFVSTFAMFATLRPFEQIRNAIAAQNLNVKIAATHSGVSVGEDGLSHQTVEDVAIIRAIPNMNVFVPADATSAEAIVRCAANLNEPVYIRMSRPKTPLIYGEDYEFYPGKADILKDALEARVAIISMGTMVFEALKTAEMLENDGYATIVADFASVKPINKEMLVAIARRSKIVVTLEEHSVIGGLGGAVCEVLSEEYPHVHVYRFGVNDVFGESGSPAALFQHFGLDAGYVYRNILKLLS